MLTIKSKIKNIQSNPAYKSDVVYLVEPINSDSGFLLQNNKIYFIVKHQHTEKQELSTQYLSLRTNIFINSVENSPTFKPDYYDLLIYSGDINYVFFDSFITLCENFVTSKHAMTFVDFFYSLVKLFQTNKENSYTNLIGLFGELYFIRYLYEKFNFQICEYWHKTSGSRDKYDFALPNFNVEVKTTSKEGLCFEIKHSQIFNDMKNYVAIINLDEDNSGETILDLVEYFQKNQPFCSDIEFLINLEIEKAKVAESDLKKNRMSLSRILLFDAGELETINSIPPFIDSLRYKYDFAYQLNKAVSLETLFGKSSLKI